jgi:rhomboid protease GluP
VASPESVRATPDPTGLKLRFVFLPLVALAAGFLVVYSLLNWLLVQRSDLVPLNDDVATYWLPGLGGWVLVLLLVQPALGLLRKDKKGNLAFWYHAGAVAMVVVPTIIAQGYIRLAAGDLAHVGSLADIPTGARSKFYSTDDACIDPSRMGIKTVVGASGRSNETLNFFLYSVTPICRVAGTHAPASVWIAEKLSHSVSNSLPQQEKNAAYDEFMLSSRTTLDHRDFSTSTFFERVGRSSDSKYFRAALEQAGMFDPDGAYTVILIPHSEPFELRTGARLSLTILAFAIGMLVWLLVALFAPLEPSAVGKWVDPEHVKKDLRGFSLPPFVVPTRRHYGLQLLLAGNILVYLAMVLSGLGFASFDSDDLIAWGGNFRPALHGWGCARLITSQFVHQGFFHVANNMWALFLAGLFLLPITDNVGLIACYLLAGLGGGIASAYAHPATVSVGASGAIFGLWGMLLVHLVLGDKRLAAAKKSLLTFVGIFVALNLILGALSPGVDNAAHLGGIAVGIALGLLWALQQRFGSRKASRQATERSLET